MIVEPPGGTELDFARRAFVLEAARRGNELVVVRCVERVEDSAGQLAAYRHAVEQSGERSGGDGIADRVAADIHADRAEALRVQIADRADMELHSEALVRIQAAQEVHDGRLVGRDLVIEQLLAGQRLGHGLLRRTFIPDGEIGRAERMVG